MSIRVAFFISLFAFVVTAVRAAVSSAGPDAAYYLQTALVLVGVLGAIVLAFALASFGAVLALEQALLPLLSRHYPLFVGWKMLRSQKASVPIVRRLAALGQLAPPAGAGRALWLFRRLGGALVAAAVGGGAFWWAVAPSTWVGAALFWLGVVASACCLFALLHIAAVALGWWLQPASRRAPRLRLRAQVTVPNFISMVGVGVGVWALILVLSVMSGFQSEVRRSILSTDAHVLVQPEGGLGPLPGALELALAASRALGVRSAEAFAESECMVASAFNSRVQLTVRGIDPAGGMAARLAPHAVDGSLRWLATPERLASFRGLALDESAAALAPRSAPAAPELELDGAPDDDAIEMPPLPGSAGVRGAARHLDDAIEMPPLPGASLSTENAASRAAVLLADPLAQLLGVAMGQTVELSVVPRDGSPPRVISAKVAGVYLKPETEADRPDVYANSRTLGGLGPGERRLLVTIRVPGGSAHSAFASVAGADSPDVAALRGQMLAGSVDALSESAISAREPTVRSGADLLDDRGSGRVLPALALGSELADSLRVRVGDEVQLVSLEAGVGPMGAMPKASPFRVAAIFRTGVYDFDLKLAYTSTEDAQRFFDTGAQANRVDVRLDDPSDTAKMLPRLRELSASPVDVLDWKALNRNLFSALQLEKIVMFLVLGLIIAVASFNIVSSLAMTVQEKSTEIAILGAMGGTRAAIRSMFLTVGTFVGIVGGITGTTLGVTTCILLDWLGVPLPPQYYIPTVPVEVNGLEVAAATAAAILLSVLATLWPAAAASRLRPAEGLRYE